MESVIKWRTGIPTKKGRYIVFRRKEKIHVDWWTSNQRWIVSKDVVAWCPVDEIEPYKELKHDLH